MNTAQTVLVWVGIPLGLTFTFIGWMIYHVRSGNMVHRCPACKMKAVYIAENEQMCARGHSFDMNGRLFVYSPRSPAQPFNQVLAALLKQVSHDESANPLDGVGP